MGFYERRICPILVDRALDNRWVRRKRQALLEPVGGRVLEIGFGSGLNLEFYSDAVEQLSVLDPAEGMHARARKRVAEVGREVDSHVLSAETLPFEPDSFDHVVCTFTLCTIPDPIAAAREVLRVLRPGGAFHLLEHVGSEDPKVRRWQDRLNPIQRALGCGCNLNRDMEPILDAAGFGERNLERIVEPKTPKIFREHVTGHARKS